MERDYLKTIQNAGLKMLHQFDDICKKNNIQYFALSGTLLGAIRHKGYIPWDDDLDLGMMREEFDKLKQVPLSEWQKDIELVDADEDCPKHDKLFPRIYLKKSRIQSYNDVLQWRNPETKDPWYTSLMIDLFVFDSIPDDNIEYLKAKKRVLRLRKLYKPSKLIANLRMPFGRQWIKSMYYYSWGVFLRARYNKPWNTIYSRYIDTVRKATRGSRVACYCAVSGNIIVPKESIYPLKMKEFEDMMIPVPNNYEEFLTLNYGESYMQFPPEKDRGHISFIFADLGNGTIINIDPIPGSLGERYIQINKKEG